MRHPSFWKVVRRISLAAAALGLTDLLLFRRDLIAGFSYHALRDAALIAIAEIQHLLAVGTIMAAGFMFMVQNKRWGTILLVAGMILSARAAWMLPSG